MRKQRRSIKKKAVRLMNDSSKRVEELAEELGISTNSLYRLRQEFQQDVEQTFPDKGYLKTDDEYARGLERELKLEKQERGILKKAVVIFSKDPSQ